MSRLIVKNLPAYLDEGRLKQHFDAHAASPITDVKIVRRPDGTSRRFGFVGFKDDKEARASLEYFNRTFIDTARIDVGLARAIDDEELKAQQLKRRLRGDQTVQPAHDESARSITAGKGNAKAVLGDTKDKRKSSKAITFDEFMDVMKPKSKRKAWSNENVDDVDAQLDPQTFAEPDSSKSKKKPKREEPTDQSKAGGGSESTPPAQDDRHAAVGDTVVNDEGMTDLEYMYKRMKRNVGADVEAKEDKQFEQSDDEEEADVKSDAPSEDQEDNELGELEMRRQQRQIKALEEKARRDQEDTDAIMQSGRLFVRNLPFEASEEEVEEYFSRYGEIAQAHITLDKDTKQSKGIAFVTFQEPSHALAAFRTSDGHTFQGRLLHILPAVQKGAVTEAKTVRDKKRQELKAKATKDFNWGALYMNSDAVASSVADRLGIDKADIINPQDDAGGKSISPAVRLALAETSVINETREFLEAQGVNVDAFEKRDSRRSDTVILVKNISYGTSSETLQAMFEKHGGVERTVMPPSGTIAIVEMQVAGEAKVAFKSLAYKRLGNSILYLEKAPIGILSGRPLLKQNDSSNGAKAQVGEASENDTSAATLATSTTTAEGATLFVKNLSFATTDEQLYTAFAKLDDVVFARVQKRTANKRDGKGVVKLSMGYGFVGFRKVDSARVAQKIMDKTMLDGHILSVTFARRGHDADDADADDRSGDATASGEAQFDLRTAPSSKLIVKNLAFQATKKDVRALFAVHGKLKSVRVPRKGLANSGGAAAGARGFGFVEFVNRNEALHAFRALRHSHLLGRHLVLEWDTEGAAAGRADTAEKQHSVTEESTSVERLRRKAAQSLAASAAAASNGGAYRREKLRLGEEDIRQAARAEQTREEDDERSDEDEQS